MGLREAFVARPGCVLVSADYSQIEMRLMAHFSQDPALIDALQALAISLPLALAQALPLPLPLNLILTLPLPPLRPLP